MTKWKGKAWPRLWAVALMGVVTAVPLTGCGVHETPDGFRFRTGNSKQTVHDALGSPDLTVDGTTWDGYPSTNEYYLSRGYWVRFRDGSLGRVTPITEEEMPDLERKVRVFRDVVPRVRIGASGSEVINEFGVPDGVDDVRHENGIDMWHRGAYQGQLERGTPPERLYCYFMKPDLTVLFQKGLVSEVRPLEKSERNRLASPSDSRQTDEVARP